MQNTTSPTGSTASPTTLPSVTLPILIGVLALRTALFFAANLLLTPIVGSYERAQLWVYLPIVVVDVLCIAIVASLLRRRGQTLRGLIGFRLRDTGWALLFTLLLVIGFFTATFIGNLVAYQGPPPMTGGTFTPPLWYGLWSLIVAPITIALAEELLYRGWALPELAARTNQVIGVLVMSLFFALQHTAFTSLDVRAQIARFIAMFLSGILFAGLYLWRQRLWPIIVAHWFLDVVGLGLPVLFAALA